MTTTSVEPTEGRLPWRLRALFAVAGTAALLRLAPPVEELPSQPLGKRRKNGQTPAWLSGRVVPGVTVEDHLASAPEAPVRVRLYRPSGLSGPLPVLLYLHGGGWVSGAVESTEAICAALAAGAGHCVASVDYRLAPEAPYPAALDDAEAALLWLRERSGDLALDPDAVSVGGDSAGGNLAAALTLRRRGTFRAQVLLYPVLDATLSCPSMTAFRGWGLRQRDMTVYRDAYVGRADPSHPELSPLLAPDVSDLPPAYVVTAGLDCLRDEGHRYAERLSCAGVPVRYRHYPDLPHGFVSLAGLCPEAGEVLSHIARFLSASGGSR